MLFKSSSEFLIKSVVVTVLCCRHQKKKAAPCKHLEKTVTSGLKKRERRSLLAVSHLKIKEGRVMAGGGVYRRIQIHYDNSGSAEPPSI